MHWFQNNSMFWGNPFGFTFFFPLIVLLAIWSLYWKARALWLAAKRNEFVWFVVLLIVNTIGVLEILYIYVFSKKQLPPQ